MRLYATIFVFVLCLQPDIVKASEIDLSFSSDIWPTWMPLPIGFADREELEKELEVQLLYSLEYKYIDGTVRVIPLGDLVLAFDQDLPSPQYIYCSEADYMAYGFSDPLGWGTDPVTNTTVPIYCERTLPGDSGGDVMAELVAVEEGMGRLDNEPWWDDEWNWLDGLIHDTRIVVKGTAEDPTPADDTEVCYTWGECVDLHMPVNGNVISTAIAIWTGSDIYVSPSFVFWAEAGPDAWDTLIVETTRSYANRYHVDYIKILLNNEWIQGADQTDFDFPACDYPLCDFYFPYSDVADWRLGLLESIGGQDALDSAVLEAAALDHGQSAQSSETTEKYLIYFVDPENERDPAGWCSEFASWAIREGTELETPVSSDSDTSIAVSDMWDYFETESRETVFAEDVWDSVGSCVQPGDYVSRDNWSHSALFVGWVDGFDDEEDINYIWVIECNVGWWDQQGGTTVGGGWRTHARISYDEDTQFSVCGPDADWVDCDVKLCLDGYNPGPDPGAPNTGEECDLFGSTAS